MHRGVQGHTGDEQGTTVKTQEVTREDSGFSCGQGSSEPVLLNADKKMPDLDLN